MGEHLGGCSPAERLSRSSVQLGGDAEKLGGSTALSGGVYYAAGTSVQRAASVNSDTADAMHEYAMTLNQWRVDPAIVRRLSDGAAPSVEWLIELGVEFRAQDLYKSGVESVPRGHQALGNGAAIAAALERAVNARMQAKPAAGRSRAESARIDVALGNRVETLLFRDGAVRGVRARGEEATAAAVVIASGREVHDEPLRLAAQALCRCGSARTRG